MWTGQEVCWAENWKCSEKNKKFLLQTSISSSVLSHTFTFFWLMLFHLELVFFEVEDACHAHGSTTFFKAWYDICSKIRHWSLLYEHSQTRHGCLVPCLNMTVLPPHSPADLHTHCICYSGPEYTYLSTMQLFVLEKKKSTVTQWHMALSHADRIYQLHNAAIFSKSRWMH